MCSMAASCARPFGRNGIEKERGREETGIPNPEKSSKAKMLDLSRPTLPRMDDENPLTAAPTQENAASCGKDPYSISHTINPSGPKGLGIGARSTGFLSRRFLILRGVT